MTSSRLRLGLVALLALGAVSCTDDDRPFPSITIQPESHARAMDWPTATAHIAPKSSVTDVVLEFGIRPSRTHAVNMSYTSEDMNLDGEASRRLPTIGPFDISYRMLIHPQYFTCGQIADYQFKVTYLNSGGSPLYHWSPRKSFEIAPQGPLPPVGPQLGASTDHNSPDLLAHYAASFLKLRD